jgi:hypothetical protein
MDYSTVLMALVASQVDQVEAEVNESLQPLLQNLVQLVTSFFWRASRPRPRPWSLRGNWAS